MPLTRTPFRGPSRTVRRTTATASNNSVTERSWADRTVALPDGRMQIVTYTAGDYTGYVADVKYEGVAKYPEYSAPAYKAAAYSAPAYKAAAYSAPAYSAPAAYEAPVYPAPAAYEAPVYPAP